MYPFEKDLKVKILIFVIVTLLLFGYFHFGAKTLLYVKSKDEEFHLVRDLPDKDEAAEMISEIKRRLKLLIKYCVQNHADNGDVQILNQRFNENNIQETDLSESATSYSIDKGKEIHLCIRSKEDAKIHQINLLMFVSIHELSHIMSTSYGHNHEFGDNFVFLLKQAVKIGIYTPIDYSKNTVKFCGMQVNSSPIF